MDLSKEEKEMYKKIGVNLGKIRTGSQEEVAKTINMKASNYNTIECGNGERHLKDYQIIKLAKHFNTSTDYILGLIDEPTPEYDIIAICNKYGLSEKSLNALKRYKDLKEDFKEKYKNGSTDKEFSINRTIDTINFLLEDLEDCKADSIIYDIYTYLNAYSNFNVTIPVVVNEDTQKVFDKAEISGEIILKIFLDSITDKLKLARNHFKEGEE